MFFKNEDGAVAIIVAVSMTLILAISALAIDVGNIYLEESKAQSAADSAAFSVGKLLPVKDTDSSKIYNIKSTAILYANKNGFDSVTEDDITFEGLKNGYFTKIRVSIKKDVEYTFAKIIGKDKASVHREALIGLMPLSGVKGVAPIGVDYNQFIAAKESGNTTNIILKYGGGDGTNGIFGFVVLDGSNGNANVLSDWMCNGYQSYINAGDELPNASGNKASVAKDGVDFRINSCTHGCTPTSYVETCPRIVKSLLYKQTDTGKIVVVGFAPFFLESVDSQANITGTYLSVKSSGKADETAFDGGLYGVKLID